MSFPLWLQPTLFWRMAWTMESANQMAGCFKSWRRAVLAIIIRYCILNTFTISQQSGLVPPNTSLWRTFSGTLLSTLCQTTSKHWLRMYLSSGVMGSIFG